MQTDVDNKKVKQKCTFATICIKFYIKGIAKGEKKCVEVSFQAIHTANFWF